MRDKFQNEFELGDVVVHPVLNGRSPVARVKKVTRKENDKLYLDNSKVAIWYPSQLINLTAYAWNEHLRIKMNNEHDWKFDGCHPHNGEYWYHCTKCGAKDWIASYGTKDQLMPKECENKNEE